MASFYPRESHLQPLHPKRWHRSKSALGGPGTGIGSGIGAGSWPHPLFPRPPPWDHLFHAQNASFPPTLKVPCPRSLYWAPRVCVGKRRLVRDLAPVSLTPKLIKTCFTAHSQQSWAGARDLRQPSTSFGFHS